VLYKREVVSKCDATLIMIGAYLGANTFCDYISGDLFVFKI